MEFADLGTHCAYKYHNGQTFLPRTCPDCKKQFCEEHIRPEAHDCPDCKKSEPKHNDSANKKPVQLCAVCKQLLTPVNEYTCKDCGKRVCMTHRFADLHGCPSEKAKEGASADKKAERTEKSKTKAKKQPPGCACCTIC